jgi:regulatory protein
MSDILEATVLRNRILGYLARRDYSRHELRQKVLKFASDRQILEQVLDELSQLDLLSDKRFACMLVRYKANAGYGPARIRQWLIQHHIPNSMVTSVLAEANLNWQVIARHQINKHFAVIEPMNIKQQARQMRYLYNRGFSQNDIRAVVAVTGDALDVN